MKVQWICLFGLLVLPFLASAVSGDVSPDGWQPIENINDPQVQEIGASAVTQYDESSKANLKFVALVKGETQADGEAIIIYRLIVQANDGSAVNSYEALLRKLRWEKFTTLSSFKPVKP